MPVEWWLDMDVLLITTGIKDIRNKTQYQHSELLVNEHETTIVSKSQVAPNIKEKSENTHCFQNWPGSGFLFPYWAILFSLYHYLHSDYDIIYTTHSSQCIFTGLVSLLLDVKWVADIWDDPQLGRQINRYDKNDRNEIIPNKPYSAVFSHVSLRLLKYCNLVILSISYEIYSTWDVNIKSENILQVTNGVDVEYVRSIADTSEENETETEEGMKIAYVGHVSRARGAGVILEAAKLLQKNMDGSFEIKLIGPINNTDSKWLETEIRTYRLEDSLKVTGALSHTNAINEVNSSDICINILDDGVENYDYAYPIKIFEYMALGKAIISTKTTGVEEILGNKNSSILLEENDPKKVAEYIQTLSNNPQFRQCLGRNAKKHSENFDWRYIRDEINSELWNLYNE
jgi:glycosyltransferase involved in cell wall biosynthesis